MITQQTDYAKPGRRQNRNPRQPAIIRPQPPNTARNLPAIGLQPPTTPKTGPNRPKSRPWHYPALKPPKAALGAPTGRYGQTTQPAPRRGRNLGKNIYKRSRRLAKGGFWRLNKYSPSFSESFFGFFGSFCGGFVCRVAGGRRAGQIGHASRRAGGGGCLFCCCGLRG